MTFRRPIVLLALAALLPAILLAAAFGVVALRQQQATLERDLLERVERLAALADRELIAQTDTLRLVARLPLFDGPVEPSAFAETAARLRRDQPLWLAVSLSDLAGNRLIDSPEPIAGVQRGRVIDEASHARAVSTGEPTIGQIRRGPRDRPAFAIRVPVIRANKVAYVLSAVIGPDALAELLLSSRLPTDWIGAIVDGEGRLVARTSGGAALIGGPASESVRAAIARQPGGIYEGTTLEGMRTVTGFRALRTADWSVHIGLPRELYRAPILRSAWLMGAAAILSALLMAAFVWLLGRELRLRSREQAAIEEARRLEALGRMTGGVAHDFNNLLMILLGNAEALKRRRGDADRVTVIADRILAAVQRGEALTRQLLAFGRRSAHEPVSFRLQDRAAELVELMTRSTGLGITATSAIPDDTWPVYTDPNAFEMALVNLAVNARDAMPDGGVLSIRARNVSLQPGRGDMELAGDFVALDVADTGTGIAGEHLGRIFEPFFTTKRNGRGTGLGLSQVHGFAKQSGGDVAVASKLGEGTTVTLYLPRARQAPAAAVVGSGTTGANGSGRVLLVEDNAEVAQVTEGILSAAGYAVSWAASADAALERVAAGECFDAVLSDIILERGMSGLELAPLLRQRCPGLPIVLMTGYSEALAKGASHGFPVLSKPFRPGEAVRALQNAMRQHATPAPPAA